MSRWHEQGARQLLVSPALTVIIPGLGDVPIPTDGSQTRISQLALPRYRLSVPDSGSVSETISWRVCLAWHRRWLKSWLMPGLSLDHDMAPRLSLIIHDKVIYLGEYWHPPEASVKLTWTDCDLSLYDSDKNSSRIISPHLTALRRLSTKTQPIETITRCFITVI